jgi:hypothetical protein
MADHPIFLGYDYTSNSYLSRLGDPSMSIKQRSFETLAAASHALRRVGLCLGAKADRRRWRIEFTEPVAERADDLSVRFFRDIIGVF